MTEEKTKPILAKTLLNERYQPLNTTPPFPSMLSVKDNSASASTTSISLETKDLGFSHTSYLDRQHTTQEDLQRIQQKAKKEGGFLELTREEFEEIHQATINLPAQSLLLNMGEAGYGVCATQKIPKGTRCEYVGVLRADTLEELNFSGRVDNPYLFSIALSNREVIASTNAEKPFRGFVGMFQHAPNSLDTLEFDNPKDKNNIQCANGSIRYVMVEGIPRVIYETTRDIQIGEGFFYDYGASYFLQQRKEALLFNKHTLQPLTKGSYRTKTAVLIGVDPDDPAGLDMLLTVPMPRSLLNSIAYLEKQAGGIMPLDPLDVSTLSIPSKVIGEIVQDKNSSFYLFPLDKCTLTPETSAQLSQLRAKIASTRLSLKKEETLSSTINKSKLETAQEAYQRSITLVKNKEFSEAIKEANSALEIFEHQQSYKGTDAEQASCHSTLASCYREMKDLSTAIYHCKNALDLRKKCLPVGHKLTDETEKKLKALKTAQTSLVGEVSGYTASNNNFSSTSIGPQVAFMKAPKPHQLSTENSSSIAIESSSLSAIEKTATNDIHSTPGITFMPTPTEITPKEITTKPNPALQLKLPGLN